MELETLQGQGASPCALLILGGAAPCGTARTPFRCIVAAAMQLIGGTMKCQGSPKATRSGLTLTRDEPRTLLLEEGKGCKAFPPAQR